MNKDRIEKLYKHGAENAKFFKYISEPIIQTYSGDKDDEEKTMMSFSLAVHMAMGAAVKRNEHILTGVAIGSIGSVVGALGFKLYNDRKKRRDTGEETGAE